MSFARWLRVVAIGAVVALAVALSGCSAPANPAATFGNHTITEDEVTAYTASYRAQNGLTDDADWKSFVSLSYGDTKTWREEAIRVLADQLLIKDKAAELGITVNNEAVEQRIAAEKAKAGIAADDERAWSDHLAAQGLTPDEFRKRLEYSSIEEQVYRAELNFTNELESELCTEYIKNNYSDQVMHHYWAIPFDKADEQRAAACLAELKGLSGDALRNRFVQLYAEVSGNDASAAGYDIGWDFLYAESTIDPDIALRSAQLAGGELYDGLLAGADGKVRVVLCDERVELVNPDYDAIDSESFKSIIRTYMLATSWAAQCNEYLSKLEEAANIKVVEPPSNLPYAIEK